MIHTQPNPRVRFTEPILEVRPCLRYFTLLILSTSVFFIVLLPCTILGQEAKLTASDGARSDLFGQTALDLSDGGGQAAGLYLLRV